MRTEIDLSAMQRWINPILEAQGSMLAENAQC